MTLDQLYERIVLRKIAREELRQRLHFSGEFDREAHPRGGFPANVGEFSPKAGGGSVTKAKGISYQPPKPEHLQGNSIHLWHGTSNEGAKSIAAKKEIGDGSRGKNASADVAHADQYPEDTGAESLVLVHADPKSLEVDPNDQIGDTVEEGLFPDGFGSSVTLGKHHVAAIFDVRKAKEGYREALQEGDFAKAKKLGVKVTYQHPSADKAKKKSESNIELRTSTRDSQAAVVPSYYDIAHPKGPAELWAVDRGNVTIRKFPKGDKAVHDFGDNTVMGRIDHQKKLVSVAADPDSSPWQYERAVKHMRDKFPDYRIIGFSTMNLGRGQDVTHEPMDSEEDQDE